MNKIFFLVISLIFTGSIFSQTAPFEINDDAPEFFILDENDNEISISSFLDDGPLILTFYRGEWCVYCNQYLDELASNSDRFAEYGATVLAISPENHDYIELMNDNTDGKLSILSDNSTDIMSLYNVAYNISEEKVKNYKKNDIDIDAHNGKGNYVLPVPATYIIDRNMKIRFVQFDEDYTYRADLEEVYRTVKSLSSERMMENEMKNAFKQREKILKEREKAKKAKNKK